MNKVVKFPVTYSQRVRNTMGLGYVPCEVSGRCLQFPEKSDVLNAGEIMEVNVMTYDSNDRPKKICGLFIFKEDIESALKNVKPSV